MTLEAFDGVVYDNVAEGLEVGDHYKIIAIIKTPSKRGLFKVMFQKVNTGGRPSDTK